MTNSPPSGGKRLDAGNAAETIDDEVAASLILVRPSAGRTPGRPQGARGGVLDEGGGSSARLLEHQEHRRMTSAGPAQ